MPTYQHQGTKKPPVEGGCNYLNPIIGGPLINQEAQYREAVLYNRNWQARLERIYASPAMRGYRPVVLVPVHVIAREQEYVRRQITLIKRTRLSGGAIDH